ncbi:MAG: hypothetical protein R3A48_22515 [Polyangiales bacterium]
MRGHAAIVLLLLGCADAPADAPRGDAFIALDRDFAGYASWPRTDLGSLTLAGHPPGPRWVHANRPPPAAGERYPVGAMLVKVVQAEPDPTQWVLFGMAKRRDDFNAAGARGWEFFVLRLSREGVPVIVSRGTAPSLVGGLYDTGDGLGCNSCHGTPDALEADGVLSPALRPGAR